MALIVCGLQSKQGRNLFWIIVYAFVGLVLSSAVIFFFFFLAWISLGWKNKIKVFNMNIR